MKTHLFNGDRLVCNKSVKKKDHWYHSSRTQNITCKRCLSSLAKGIQTEMDFTGEDQKPVQLNLFREKKSTLTPIVRERKKKLRKIINTNDLPVDEDLPF